MNALIGTIFDPCDDALAALDAPRREARLRADLYDIQRAAFRAGDMVQRLRDYAALEPVSSRDAPPRFLARKAVVSGPNLPYD